MFPKDHSWVQDCGCWEQLWGLDLQALLSWGPSPPQGARRGAPSWAQGPLREVQQASRGFLEQGPWPPPWQAEGMGCRPRAQGYICTATRGDAAARVWGWTGGRSAVLPGPLPGASWVSEGEGGPWLELGPPKWTGSWPPGATVWLCPYPEACPFQSRDPRSRTHLSTPGLGPLWLLSLVAVAEPTLPTPAATRPVWA